MVKNNESSVVMTAPILAIEKAGELKAVPQEGSNGFDEQHAIPGDPAPAQIDLEPATAILLLNPNWRDYQNRLVERRRGTVQTPSRAWNYQQGLAGLVSL